MTAIETASSANQTAPSQVSDPLTGVEVDAVDLLMRAVNGDFLSSTVMEIAEIGVPDALIAGPRTPESLAAELGCDAEVLGRMLRFLAGASIFEDCGDGTFGHNAASELMCSSIPDSMAGPIRFQKHLLRPAFGRVGDALRDGSVAFEKAFGASFYEQLAAHPDLEADWNKTMGFRAGRIGADLAGLIDWTGVSSVIDVGGNRGDLLIELMRDRDDVRGTVFDQPHVADDASRVIAASGLGDRLEFRGGDFFLGVPSGFDLYLLANVLWNWEDDQAELILATLRAAMEPGARMVAVETLLPSEPGNHLAKALDLANLYLFGGRCRTLDQWRSLLGRTGFRIVEARETQRGWSVVDIRAV